MAGAPIRHLSTLSWLQVSRSSRGEPIAIARKGSKVARVEESILDRESKVFKIVRRWFLEDGDLR